MRRPTTIRALASVAGTVGARGTNAALTVVVAGALTVDDFALFSALQSAFVLTSAFAVFGFDTHLLRRDGTAYRPPSDCRYFSAKAITGAIAGGLMMAYMAVAFGAEFTGLAAIAVAAGLLSGLAETPESRLAIANRYVARAIAQSVPAAVVTVAAAVILLGSESASRSLLLTATVMLAVRETAHLAVAQRLRSSLLRQDQSGTARIRVLIREAGPYAAVSVLTYVYFRIDALILGAFAEPSDLAGYNAQYTILMGGTAVSAALGALWLRRLVADATGWKRLAGRNAVLGAAIGVCFLVSAEPVTRLLYGERYAYSAHLLQILALTLPISFANSVSLRLLYARDRERIVPSIVAGATALNVAINLSLVGTYGATGAAWATVATETFLFCALAGAAARSDRITKEPV